LATKVTRRQIKGEIVALPSAPPQLKHGQQQFAFIESAENFKTYEYAVLVTSLPDELLTISQWYRDRADCENVFDEIKNRFFVKLCEERVFYGHFNKSTSTSK